MHRKITDATNVDRAAKIIGRAMLAASFSAPERRPLMAADALAKAGLLAPDLPPVVVDDFDERPHVTITGTHPKDNARLRVDEHGVFHAVNAWSDPRNPAEARERAYALLALANHVEGDTDD